MAQSLKALATDTSIGVRTDGLSGADVPAGCGELAANYENDRGRANQPNRQKKFDRLQRRQINVCDLANGPFYPKSFAMRRAR